MQRAFGSPLPWVSPALVFSFQDRVCQSPHQLLQRDPGDWVGKVGHGGGIPVSITSSWHARPKKIPPIRPLMAGLGSNVHLIKNIFHSRGCVINLRSCGFEAAARLCFLVSSLVLRSVVSHIHKLASQLSLSASAGENTFLTSVTLRLCRRLPGRRLMTANKSCLCPDESKLIFLVQRRTSWAAVFNFQTNCLWIYLMRLQPRLQISEVNLDKKERMKTLRVFSGKRLAFQACGGMDN